jgi:putative flippase GtrA
VGGIGFLVDGGILTLLTSEGVSIFTARLISFLLAVSATWLLNRSWTFVAGSYTGSREYFLYFLIQALGAAINLSIFYLLILGIPDLKSLLLIPLALGAGVSLIFNFIVSKYFIFKKAA